MLRDQYDSPVSTASAVARDAYVSALDGLLGAEPDMRARFDTVVAADPGFALGHAGLARVCAVTGDGPGAKTAIARAEDLTGSATPQEAAQIAVLSHLLNGRGPEAYRAARAHVDAYPRDVLVAQTCTSIYGLIGLSGQPGREAELLAYTASLLPHYGDDWWCLSQHAFSLCETGQIDRADTMIDRSLALNGRNAHAAHVRSHVYYEAGETRTGIDFLDDWLKDYDHGGLMHGHLSWHRALWALETGEPDRVWSQFDASIAPAMVTGAAPMAVLADSVSLLFRAELAGETIDPAHWRAVSAYAQDNFATPGLAFADVHAAIAHAMAGATDALERIISDPKGPAAPLVRDLAKGYRAVARQDWPEAVRCMTEAMTDHARIGGSRAQRDLLELSLLGALLKDGRRDEARRLLVLHRPVLAEHPPVMGL